MWSFIYIISSCILQKNNDYKVDKIKYVMDDKDRIKKARDIVQAGLKEMGLVELLTQGSRPEGEELVDDDEKGVYVLDEALDWSCPHVPMLAKVDGADDRFVNREQIQQAKEKVVANAYVMGQGYIYWTLDSWRDDVSVCLFPVALYNVDK